jgi:hypothetical protein
MLGATCLGVKLDDAASAVRYIAEMVFVAEFGKA